ATVRGRSHFQPAAMLSHGFGHQAESESPARELGRLVPRTEVRRAKHPCHFGRIVPVVDLHASLDRPLAYPVDVEPAAVVLEDHAQLAATGALERNVDAAGRGLAGRGARLGILQPMIDRIDRKSTRLNSSHVK